MDEESIANYVVIEFDENKAWYNFEFLVGTPDNDVIIAVDHTAMEYIGGDGDDEIYGGAQGEIIDGGAGHDVLTGGDGADTFRISVLDELPDIISDFSADDIVDLTRLGIGSKDELSLKEETLVINDFEYSGTILSRTKSLKELKRQRYYYSLMKITQHSLQTITHLKISIYNSNAALND